MSTYKPCPHCGDQPQIVISPIHGRVVSISFSCDCGFSKYNNVIVDNIIDSIYDKLEKRWDEECCADEKNSAPLPYMVLPRVNSVVPSNNEKNDPYKKISF